MKIDYDQDLPCGVCRDLIPLVRDGVACADSRRLVEAHTAHCAACRAFLEADGPLPDPPEARRVLPKIYRHLRVWILGVTAIGLLLGMMLLFSSEGAPYNTIIMPVLGALLWFFGGRHRRLLPLGVGGLYSVALLVYLCSNISAGADWGAALRANLGYLLLVSALHLAGCYLGMLAAALLEYAFTKEEMKDEEEQGTGDTPGRPGPEA